MRKNNPTKLFRITNATHLMKMISNWPPPTIFFGNQSYFTIVISPVPHETVLSTVSMRSVCLVMHELKSYLPQRPKTCYYTIIIQKPFLSCSLFYRSAVVGPVRCVTPSEHLFKLGFRERMFMKSNCFDQFHLLEIFYWRSGFYAVIATFAILLMKMKEFFLITLFSVHC